LGELVSKGRGDETSRGGIGEFSSDKGGCETRLGSIALISIGTEIEELMEEEEETLGEWPGEEGGIGDRLPERSWERLVGGLAEGGGVSARERNLFLTKAESLIICCCWSVRIDNSLALRALLIAFSMSSGGERRLMVMVNMVNRTNDQLVNIT
jgi:hypothetical protein